MEITIYSIIVIGLLTLLINRWFRYSETIRSNPGFTTRRIVWFVFLAFVSLTGIGSILAETLFKLFGFQAPNNFQLYSLIAFIIFAIVGIIALISSTKKNKAIINKNTGSGKQININTPNQKGGKVEVNVYDEPQKKNEFAFPIIDFVIYNTATARKTGKYMVTPLVEVKGNSMLSKVRYRISESLKTVTSFNPVLSMNNNEMDLYFGATSELKPFPLPVRESNFFNIHSYIACDKGVFIQNTSVQLRKGLPYFDVINIDVTTGEGENRRTHYTKRKMGSKYIESCFDEDGNSKPCD